MVFCCNFICRFVCYIKKLLLLTTQILIEFNKKKIETTRAIGGINDTTGCFAEQAGFIELLSLIWPCQNKTKISPIYFITIKRRRDRKGVSVHAINDNIL